MLEEVLPKSVLVHGVVNRNSHFVIQISHNNANQRTRVALPTTRRTMRSLVSIIMGYLDDYTAGRQTLSRPNDKMSNIYRLTKALYSINKSSSPEAALVVVSKF